MQSEALYFSEKPQQVVDSLRDGSQPTVVQAMQISGESWCFSSSSMLASAAEHS